MKKKQTAEQMIENLVEGYRNAAHADPKLAARVKLFLDLPEHLRWALLFWGVRTACDGIKGDTDVIATMVLKRIDEAMASTSLFDSAGATKQ